MYALGIVVSAMVVGVASVLLVPVLSLLSIRLVAGLWVITLVILSLGAKRLLAGLRKM